MGEEKGRDLETSIDFVNCKVYYYSIGILVLEKNLL